MEAAATPSNGTATAATTSNSTAPTGATTSSSSSNGRSISVALLCIIIPFAVIIFASIIGAAVYFYLRRRRRAKREARDEDGSRGVNVDAERSVCVAGRDDGGGDALITTLRLTAAEMEEGFNELGEAPPPYVRAKIGDPGAQSARAGEEQDEEAGGSSSRSQERSRSRSQSRDRDQNVVDVPPPAYDAVAGRHVESRLSSATPTAVCGVSLPVAHA